MSQEGLQLSVLRDRIEGLLFRLRRDDERMEAQLSSGLAGIFASNAMQREDVVKALEEMLAIPESSSKTKVKVTIQPLLSGPIVIECEPGNGEWYPTPRIGFGTSVKVDRA